MYKKLLTSSFVITSAILLSACSDGEKEEKEETKENGSINQKTTKNDLNLNDYMLEDSLIRAVYNEYKSSDYVLKKVKNKDVFLQEALLLKSIRDSYEMNLDKESISYEKLHFDASNFYSYEYEDLTEEEVFDINFRTENDINALENLKSISTEGFEDYTINLLNESIIYLENKIKIKEFLKENALFMNNEAGHRQMIIDLTEEEKKEYKKLEIIQNSFYKDNAYEMILTHQSILHFLTNKEHNLSFLSNLENYLQYLNFKENSLIKEDESVKIYLKDIWTPLMGLFKEEDIKKKDEKMYLKEIKENLLLAKESDVYKNNEYAKSYVDSFEKLFNEKDYLNKGENKKEQLKYLSTVLLEMIYLENLAVPQLSLMIDLDFYVYDNVFLNSINLFDEEYLAKLEEENNSLIQEDEYIDGFILEDVPLEVYVRIK